jgi:hypothetical protein
VGLLWFCLRSPRDMVSRRRIRSTRAMEMVEKAGRYCQTWSRRGCRPGILGTVECKLVYRRLSF